MASRLRLVRVVQADSTVLALQATGQSGPGTKLTKFTPCPDWAAGLVVGDYVGIKEKAGQRMYSRNGSVVYTEAFNG